jgi:hypothetical protein
MNLFTRRNALRASGLALVAPFTGSVMGSFGQMPSVATSQPTQSNTSVPTLNSELLNYVIDHTAKGVASAHAGQRPDYAAISAHCRMMARHFDELGLDPLVKQHASDMLSALSYPSIDQQWKDAAVSRIQKHDPSFTANDLMSKNASPATSADWASALTTLKNKGFVACCHDAADQLSYMATVTSNPGSAAATVAYQRLQQTNGVHVLDIKCLGKFFLCLGGVVVAGAAVIALTVAVCGATGFVACVGGTVWAAAVVAEFGLVTGALITACGAFLVSDNQKTIWLEIEQA